MAKVAAAMILAMALYTIMAAQVGAVDIVGYTSSTGCSGEVNTRFPAHPDGACAPFASPKAGSVLFTGLTNCKEGIVYNVDCADIINRKTGPPSSVCFVGGGFTSAKWRTIPGCV
ncbi:hypothetical protein KC19_4G222600 [Ceratodon purpureus]|uniref:Secreted protein n=1 Tax=Ceratodon purpureus TaxID=3225 RepID=A0A8T0IDX7_CERPU|nr:hypothetical protein KC19_4G222600 [Ceratodon purpureus]